jgi:hypothetical protein
VTEPQDGGKEMKLWIALGLVLLLATSVFAVEPKEYLMRPDFGTEQLGDYPCQFFYHIPISPEDLRSYYWAFSGWDCDTWMGQCFECWHQNTYGLDPMDPLLDHTVQAIEFLDFAGYGTLYPGLFTIELCMFCQDPVTKNPVEDPPGWYTPLWCSGPIETHPGWNIFYLDPPVCVTDCCLDLGPPPAYPAVLMMAHLVGTDCAYPAFAWDNMSSPTLAGFAMHDIGCLPVHYPRPYVCYWDQMHSGYYGVHPFSCCDEYGNPVAIPAPFPYCPPLNLVDPRDTTTCPGYFCLPDGVVGQQYGFLELAWTIYLDRSGPTATEGTTWGNIKSMYR